MVYGFHGCFEQKRAALIKKGPRVSQISKKPSTNKGQVAYKSNSYIGSKHTVTSSQGRFSQKRATQPKKGHSNPRVTLI